ncbi:unnamed protein product [Trichogramma brassicae]|uniref:DNA repair endonuclease XPF n=1 Tax=Trichogramma brassicae TaxID=86971 RepID=A0A6H5IFM9_9HYME|nr:unnamed protein product [Trichogramma brassicae]
MLEYENQMFLEILQEDGLVIAAKGLGLETVFMNILKAYSDPGHLVLVLGTDDFEETFFIEQLKNQGVKHLPRVVSAQSPAEERDIMYLEGGVLFISGRILVVDLLKNRVPLNLLSGMLVYKAHSILTSHQESFALRLYRKGNKTGFVKAFTNSAIAFTVGMSQVEQVMKRLYVKKLNLWPRFHKTVNTCLAKHKLDLDELTVENAVANKFHKQLQLQLDPVWDQLSYKSKQLISDLKTQRSLLMCLTHDDSVSFYAMLNSLRTMEYAMRSSGWTMLDVVDDMFKNAKLRVFAENGDLKPEPNPKWTALSEILLEIETDSAKNKKNKIVPKILILTRDGKTCRQLNNYLTMGSKEYLLYEAMKKLKPDKIQAAKKPEMKKKETSKNTESSSGEESIENSEEERESYVLTMTQKAVNDEEDEDNEKSNSSDEKINSSQCFEECSKLEDLDLTTLSATQPLLVIESMKRNGDSMSLHKRLDEMSPNYVVLYAADISAVRQLEVYQNKNPSIPLKVYFLIYGGSVEEQAYLTSLRREKEAFEKLVMAKTTMVISAEQDGKSEETTSTDHAIEEESNSNTRKGGLKEDQPEVVNKIIVDMREFRSELPSMLHQRGMEVEPVTITIGDYILSPDICVERKSIADLIGSLNSGRLYNQAVAMTRYYAKPMLLIEFDQNKPFGLQGNYYISRGMRSLDITNKLQLLTMHFPRLKLVWSPSPTATAQLFEELKQGRPQPDAAKAAQVGTEDDIDDENTMAEKYNVHIQDLIAKLPGVHSKNLRAILNKGISLDHLLTLSKVGLSKNHLYYVLYLDLFCNGFLIFQSELSEIISNSSDADLLYNALHSKTKAPNDGSSASGIKPNTSKVKKRGLFFKKRGK